MSNEHYAASLKRAAEAEVADAGLVDPGIIDIVEDAVADGEPDAAGVGERRADPALGARRPSRPNSRRPRRFDHGFFPFFARICLRHYARDGRPSRGTAPFAPLRRQWATSEGRSERRTTCAGDTIGSGGRDGLPTVCDECHSGLQNPAIA